MNDEMKTEDLRLQIINNEASQSLEESGVAYPEVISKEEAEAMEQQTLLGLVREREEIKRKRELEEKEGSINPVTGKSTDPEFELYIKR